MYADLSATAETTAGRADEVRREIDPEVLLYYNEIGIERIGPKSDFAYQMIKELLAKGVPIDGIGLQSHVSTHRYPSEDDIRATYARDPWAGSHLEATRSTPGRFPSSRRQTFFSRRTLPP